MTLGGLALAVGILVDDATVTIENINRHLEEGRDVESAILEGSRQILVPALVSTLSICIVFVPMFLLTGVARYLFVPMAEAVVFAMLASYVLSRTLVPTLAKYWLRTHAAGEGSRRANPNALQRFQRRFEARFERVARRAITRTARQALRHRTRVHRRVPRRRAAVAAAVSRCSAATFSPRSMRARSSCTCARPPACASRRPPRWSITSKPRFASVIPAARAREHRRQHRPAGVRHQPHVRQLRHHRHQRCRHPDHARRTITARPPTTSASCASACRGNFRARRSRSCPPTSSARS